jgi:hypothetical protein
MVKTPLAFEFSKTRTICDAFDKAWASLQGVGSDLTAPSKSLASRTILAKRIIEMADQGVMDVTELRDDALAFVQHNPPSGGSQRKPCGGDAGILACGADASLRPTRSGAARIGDANATTTRAG